MKDRFEDLTDALPDIDPGPAFTAAVLAALPAASRPPLRHGRWMVGILTAVVLLLWWDPGSGAVTAAASWSAGWAVVRDLQADLWPLAASIPWPLLTRCLYAVAAGLVLAWSVPNLAVGRRRIGRH